MGLFHGKRKFQLQHHLIHDTMCKVIKMKYDKSLITHKLIRWENYLQHYTLPEWKDLPNIGLYMDQVIALLSSYLDFIPMPVDKPSERPITPTTINNYVRLKVMPAPEKRKYYRIHIAYLIMIFILKQSVSISSLQKMIPVGLSPDEVQEFYQRFVKKLHDVGYFFTQQTRLAAQDILAPDSNEVYENSIDGLILQSMLMAGFSGILAEKLLQLQGADPEEVLRREVPHEE